MTRANVVSVVMLAALPGWAGPAVDTVTIEAVGEAASDDEAKALELAKHRALVAALEQVAGVTVQADTQVVDGALVYDLVQAETGGFISQHQWVKVARTKDLTQVTVRATLQKSKVLDLVSLARAALMRRGKSRLVLSLNEVEVSAERPGGLAGTRLTQALAKALEATGWQVVSSDEVESLDTDLMLKGRLHLEVNERSTATGAFELVQRRGFTKVLADSLGPFFGESADEVGLQLGEQVVLFAYRGLLASERRARTEGASFTVVAKGFEFGDIDGLTRVVQAAPGVVRCDVDEFDRGTQRYLVVFRGDAGLLSKVLSKQTFKNRPLTALANRQGQVMVGLR